MLRNTVEVEWWERISKRTWMRVGKLCLRVRLIRENVFCQLRMIDRVRKVDITLRRVQLSSGSDIAEL